jgi:hypothetical protein
MVGVLALAIAATVVPHEPAPTTATLISDDRDTAGMVGVRRSRLYPGVTRPVIDA